MSKRDENLYSYEARRDLLSGDPTLYCVDKRDPRSRAFMSANEIKGSQPYVDASIRNPPGVVALRFLEVEGKTLWAEVDVPIFGKVGMPNHAGFRNAIFPISLRGTLGEIARKIGLRS